MGLKVPGTFGGNMAIPSAFSYVLVSPVPEKNIWLSCHLLLCRHDFQSAFAETSCPLGLEKDVDES